MENLRNLSRWGMFAFLSVALCTSFVGCSDDDPDYSNVTPPTVSEYQRACHRHGRQRPFGYREHERRIDTDRRRWHVHF